MKKIFLVTGNKKKLDIAKSALSAFNIDVEQINIDTPEIQAKTIEEVAKYSVKYAADLTGKAVIKGDVGLEIPALGGFPGPFIKYINQWLSVNQFINLFKNEKNREAIMVDALGYCKPGKEPICFVAKTHGKLIDTPKGDNGVMVDSVFVPKGHNKTLAEFSNEETIKFWSNDRYKQFSEYQLGKYLSNK